MSETKTIENATSNSWKMMRAMVGIGAVCALLIVFTFEVSKPRIETLKKEALEKAIKKVLPGIAGNQAFTLSKDTFIPAEGKTEGPVVYAGYDEEGNLNGLCIEAAGQGYADIIRILYGYNPEKQTGVGFIVLESKETPGLGDKIETEQRFLDNFEGLDLALNPSGDALQNEVVAVSFGTKENPWEIEGITGATITSRAISDIINKNASQIIPLIVKNMETFEKYMKSNENRK